MNSFLNIFFGSMIIELVGASSKWLVFAFADTLKRKKVAPFRKTWGTERISNLQTSFERGYSNILWGYGTIIFLIFIGLLIDKFFY